VRAVVLLHVVEVGGAAAREATDEAHPEVRPGLALLVTTAPVAHCARCVYTEIVLKPAVHG